MPVHAVIPAAGASRRMGRPKLTLPLANSTVIQQTLGSLNVPGIDARVVVIRQSDAELWEILAEIPDVHVLAPVPEPPDMRASVAAGLKWIAETCSPADSDAWALMPADCPAVAAATVSQILQIWESSDADVLIPEFDGHGGHPTLLRWSTVAQVLSLPEDQGINALWNRPGLCVQRCRMSDRGVVQDVDTPDDWQSLRERTGGSP